ncbi:hypothetical protein D915_010260 [Fasciola hepatica]|uniref:Uncharacterized protein n=1 Tax=Fasciola hepatica TaxID=6192 RepID=A0A4E0QUX6_FASHE|nr:hypothetical protein D915_010260 [Fasciola hepatica]
MDGNIWKLKFRTNSHISSFGTLVPDRNGFIVDINNSSKSKTINMNESDPFDSPVLSRDPSVIQEILNKVEDQYYSMTFDSGKFEIEVFICTHKIAFAIRKYSELMQVTRF